MIKAVLMSLFLAPSILNSPAPITVNGLDAQQVVNNMLASIDKIQGMKFRIKTKERFGSNYDQKHVFFKVWHGYPRKIYMKDMDKGIELLYLDKWNDNKCLINPNGFPYINVSFGPLSSRVRENNHHSIFEAGYKYVAEGMRKTLDLVKKNNRKLDNHFKIAGEITWNGKSCVILSMENDEYKFENYTVVNNESPRDIAMKLKVNEQTVMDINNIGLGNLKTGRVIKVPNSYAKKVVFYVDKSQWIPIFQEVYDEKGLYERYEYHDVQINPTFQNQEFSKDFGEYKF